MFLSALVAGLSVSEVHLLPGEDLFLNQVNLGKCNIKEAARVVYNRVLAPMPPVFSRMAHIGKGKEYAS